VNRHARPTGLILVAVVALVPLATACVTTYRDFPLAMIDKPSPPATYDALSYQIQPFPVINVGGESALHRAFRERAPFAKTKGVTQVPADGIFCLVSVEWKPPTLPALVFGFLSVSSLTFLPAWSTREGYIVRYHVFVDGTRRETFAYAVTRKFGLWLGLLPFAWINFQTYSEAQAFDATAQQFFRDASRLFAPVAGKSDGVPLDQPDSGNPIGD
jgi:hypothetical protein